MNRLRLLSQFRLASRRHVGAFLLVVGFGLIILTGLHGGSDAWAQPTQAGLRGTIPTPTPMPDSGAPLQQGWNLISICVSPSSTVITDVLSTIEGQYDLVYAYHASDTADPWKKYNTAAPPFLNDLTEIDETMGLWIRATEAVTLTVSGFTPGFTDIQLYTGWNWWGIRPARLGASPMRWQGSKGSTIWCMPTMLGMRRIRGRSTTPPPCPS